MAVLCLVVSTKEIFMDENEFEFDGVNLVAETAEEMSGCDGCYFDDKGDSCSTADRPFCHRFFRLDETQVIFVEKQQ